MTRVLALAGLAWLVLASPARADGQGDDAAHPSYRAVIDRVDLEPASITGYRLRVYLSALALQGHLLDLTDPKSIKLMIGSSEKKIPYTLGSYSATTSDTEIVFVVQTTADFADALPMISDALDRELLGHVADRTKVAIIPYGESTATAKLAPVKTMHGKVVLASDNSVGDPVLLDAIDRALLVLKKTKPEVEGRLQRKMIVVIGDGRDAAADRDRVTRTGTRAAKDGVRIHALAYSPTDMRRTLLVLGELSKRSLGTLRWPGLGHKPTADTWSDAFKELAAEINQQYVLTYYASAEDDVLGKKLHVVTVGRTEASSNEVKVPSTPECAGVACEVGYCADDKCLVPQEGGGGAGHVLRWVLIVGGILVGAIVLLGLVGFVMTNRQQRPEPVAGTPPTKRQKKQKDGPVPPGFLANGRPIPALILMTGPRAGERIMLKHGFLIGKQPGCDLLIEDGYTSSQHAQIGMDAAGNCKLYDRGSTNGTLVNGVRITETALEHGATIKIGSIEMRFLAQ